MPGRIIFTPRPPGPCISGCADKPVAGRYPDGTIWQCDLCQKRWERWSGAQYNESFSAWRAAPPDRAGN